MIVYIRHLLSTRVRIRLAVLLSILVLSACNGGIKDDDAGAGIPTATTDGTSTSSTENTAGNTAGNQSAGDTAGTTDESTAGGSAGASDGVTTGETDGGTASDTDGGVTGDTDGSTTAELDAGTAGETDGSTTTESDGGTTSASGTSTAGDSAGSTTAESDGGTAGESDASTAGETDGSTAGESDGGTAGTSDGSTAGESDGSTPADPDPTPVVRAPADAQILINDSIELNGSVIFNGMPIDIPVIDWQKNSGPGVANFTNTASASTSVSFDVAGSYELQLRATNGSYTSSDTMLVIVTSDVENQAPVVNAGPDEMLLIDEVLNLSAQVDDDGLPSSTLVSEWTMLSGPGDVTFGEVSSKATTATFSTPGVYFLEFTSTDGELTGDDLIRVSVSNTPPENNSGGNVNAANNWQNVTTSNGSKPQGRHEAGAVAFQDELYLMGGRGNRPVNRYNPVTNRWENLSTPALELNHFQPVVYGGKIYVLGPLDCCFPRETVIAEIQIFDPATKTWSQGESIPLNRQRGSAGVLVHNNKIYMLGGSTNGHDGGMVNWFDEYNPATDTWKTLPSAPSERDHFSAAMVGKKLIAAGGRKTDHPNTFSNLVSAVDIYDFGTGTWSSGAPIKTKRAGAMTVSYGEEIILIGGESDSGVPALSTVEAYNVNTDTWRTLDSLNTGRHSGGAAIVGGAIHVVSGNITTGGGNETQSHEKLELE